MDNVLFNYFGYEEDRFASKAKAEEEEGQEDAEADAIKTR